MCVTPLSPPLVAQHPLQVGLTGFVLRTPHLGCQPVASSRRVWLPAPSLGASPGGGAWRLSEPRLGNSGSSWKTGGPWPVRPHFLWTEKSAAGSPRGGSRGAVPRGLTGQQCIEYPHGDRVGRGGKCKVLFRSPGAKQ